jgi:hypothetical protein
MSESKHRSGVPRGIGCISNGAGCMIFSCGISVPSTLPPARFAVKLIIKQRIVPIRKGWDFENK